MMENDVNNIPCCEICGLQLEPGRTIDLDTNEIIEWYYQCDCHDNQFLDELSNTVFTDLHKLFSDIIAANNNISYSVENSILTVNYEKIPKIDIERMEKYIKRKYPNIKTTKVGKYAYQYQEISDG
jgi:hypothetical protein